MMFAVLIIMVSMLAYLTSMVIVMRTSLNNDNHDVVTRVANQTGEALLALPFDTTDSDLTTGVTHSRIANDSSQDSRGFPPTTQVVRGAQKILDIKWTPSPMSFDTLQIMIGVTMSSGPTQTLVVFKNRSI